MTKNQIQLNPFELKATVVKLLTKINSKSDLQKCLSDIELLGNQEDKTLLSKILFKELVGAQSDKIPLICFLLETFLPNDMLIHGLWEVLKNKNLKTDIRVIVLNMLRELDADWSYEDCSEFVDDADYILDENTKQLLKSAVINPEIQIDFMDFLYSINTDDKLTLLNSFKKDFDAEALASIYIPVFESSPFSTEGKESLNLLSETKSVLALHCLENMDKLTFGELNKQIRKSLAILKMSGIREDNTVEIYKKLLSDTKPDKFYITYPDGDGDCALIFTRKTTEGKIRFVSVVINLDTGIKDCFGFFEISQFECDKILERFLKHETAVSIKPQDLKNILFNAEIKTINKTPNYWTLPYEYVCWKNLLIDIGCEAVLIDEILDKNVEKISIDESIIKNLDSKAYAQHWFLDGEYSLEFENLLKELKDKNNLEQSLNNNFQLIFDNEEKISWHNKILFCAYIEFVTSNFDEAKQLYSLAYNNKLFEKFLMYVLKRSIYEYLVLIKYNKDLNKYLFTADDISSKIEYIEKNWVNSDV